VVTRIEARAMLRISAALLSLIPSFFSRPGWVDASRTVPTSLVPLHRQLLRDIEQQASTSSQAHLPTEFHSTDEQARNTKRIDPVHPSQKWIKLDETATDGIPPPRRGHSSTIYKKDNAILEKYEGTTTDTSGNSTAQVDHGAWLGVQEYMIVSGGFTNEEWNTFPVWSYDITGAVLRNHGEWKLIDDVIADEGLCTGLNDIDNINDFKDGRDLWNNAVNCPPQSRYGHISVVHNDYLYVFGGLLYDQQNGVFVMEDEPYIYRINLLSPSAWQRIVARITPPPSNLTNLTDDDIETEKFIINRGEVRGGYWEEEGKLIIHGGLHVQDYHTMYGKGLQQKDEPLGDVWAYDFESATWEMMAPSREPFIINDTSHSAQYPEPRTSHAATIVGNELIICGGLKKIRTLLDGTTMWEQLTDVWIFDLKTRLWKERVMAQPIGRSHHSLVGWEDIALGGPVVALFGGYKTGYDAISSSPMPTTYIYDDVLISSPSEKTRDWLEVAVKVQDRPASRREHTAVLSEYGNMLIWGGRLLTTDDDQIAGVWSLNVKSSNLYDAADDNGDGQALEEFYLLVTTIFFISMMFTYMCGTLARHSSNDINDGIIDSGDHFTGFDSITSSFGRSNGLGQDIIDTLPLKTYHNNDSMINDAYEVDGASSLNLGRTPLNDTPPSSSRGESESNQDLDIDAEVDVCCAICIVNYKYGDELRALPCGHEFHKPCIDAWLGNNASCPACRYSLQSLAWLTTDTSHPMSWARISNLTLLGSNPAENISETGIRQSNFPHHHVTLSSLIERLRSLEDGAEIVDSTSGAPVEDRGIELPANATIV